MATGATDMGSSLLQDNVIAKSRNAKENILKCFMIFFSYSVLIKLKLTFPLTLSLLVEISGKVCELPKFVT